jgi:hypothetical protein
MKRKPKATIAPQVFAVGDRVQAIWSNEIIGTVKTVRYSKQGTQLVLVNWDMSNESESELIAQSLACFAGEPSKECFGGNLPPENIRPANTAMKLLPPEDSEADQLRAQIAAIRAEGAIAPDHCWIEQWKRAENFVEVRYKARSPIFPGKRGGLASSQYIGKQGSPAHGAAVKAVDRRNRIAKLEKQLEKLNA